MSYSITKDVADEITLSNGKKYYTGVNSMNSVNAKGLGLTVKTITFKGCCIAENINNRAKEFPIEIDGVDILTFIDEVADENEQIS